MPAAERHQETGASRSALRRSPRITGRIQAAAWTRKGADAGQVSLWRADDDDTGTEGQVGRHDDATGGGGRGSGRDGERTGGRDPRVARRELASRRGHRTAPTPKDLHGDAGRGPGEGPQPGEADA